MLNISKQRINDALEKDYEIYILSTLGTPRTILRLMRWLLGILMVFILVLFLPWQQNVTGKGGLTALSPSDRPQTVQNFIDGSIKEWRIKEGQKVNKGDTLLLISEIKDEYFDPNIMLRIDEQISAKDQAIDSYRQKVQALQNQMNALEENRKFSLRKAENYIAQSRAKVISDSTDLVNERIQYNIANERYLRGKQQYDQGILSLISLESREMKQQEVSAKVVSTQNKLEISKQGLLSAIISLNAVSAEYNEKIAKARSDYSSALAAIADGQSELSKLVNKRASVDTRQGYYVVRAPQTGVVVKALKAGIGETIKQGEAICTLQPDRPNLAVELYISAMDVPLIQKNREVRIQFEGWPAIQFSGWPNVSVGTFGGTVSVIDLVDSKNGEYRLLVTPKEDDEPWPEQLRIGSGVYGWVMLDNVPVWYEIWRQLNAFPPSLKNKPEGDETNNESAKK
ncbi:Biotin-lipoyl like [Spirosomataceae bacterium TFI 002]|nr:Biotin-lipoyl like [Spirosomataceae bacterium TFI 002]